MNENYYPQTADEHARETDKLFLEFAIKKCSLTLSKEEILSQTERLLNEMTDEKVEEILTEYRESRTDEIPPAPAAKESAVSGRSRDAPEVVPAEAGEAALEKRQKKKKSFWGDLLFYGVLIALIIGVAVLAKGSAQGPRSFAGFTAQTVLTSSTESVIPKGSLVISRYTDPNTLQIGDDITFMTNETTTVTHRIIGITEKYGDTGQRAFQTQGVMNASPDSQLVPAANVVGKVVFHSLTAGKIAAFLESYWPLLLFFIIVIAVLIRVLKHIYRKDGGRTDKENQKRGKRFFLAKAIQTQSKEEQT